MKAGAADNRSDAGRRARAAGEDFETLVDQWLDALLDEGLLAWWRGVGPRVRWVRRGAQAVPVPVGVGPVDRIAQASARWGGRAVVIEAKSLRHGDRLRRGSHLPAHQVDHLDAALAGGGVALLLVEFQGPEPSVPWHRAQRFAVPWGSAPWQTAGRFRGAGSIGAGDLVGWDVTGAEGLSRRVMAVLGDLPVLGPDRRVTDAAHPHGTGAAPREQQPVRGLDGRAIGRSFPLPSAGSGGR